VAVGRLPNLWATATASRRVSAVQLRKVPDRAVVAVAVLGTMLLLEVRTALVPSRSSHAVVAARMLFPSPLMLGLRRKLQQQMGEKESGNKWWSV
jgi:threonine/homoserine efflux transporter RhtA